MTNVEQVEKWYAAHEERLARHCSVLRINTLTPLDEMRGKTEIRVETQTTLASVTFWNQGDVAVLTVDRATRKESILDDRKLTAEDEIESLLNRYFQQIVQPAVHP
jgi:hypothetical protein